MKRNKFSLSHYKLFTCNMGELIPITWYEVIPGDTFQQRTSLVVRTSPLIAPIYHPVAIRLHHFYVPNRQIWEDWEEFITGGGDEPLNTGVRPDPANDPVTPSVTCTNSSHNSIMDYLGLPKPSIGNDRFVSALPFRAYNRIYNEWYRDEQIDSLVAENVASGPDAGPYDIKNVAWQKDYLTTARPFPDRGPAVKIPVSGLVQDDGNATVTGPLLQSKDGSAADHPNANYRNAMLPEGISSVEPYPTAWIDPEDMREGLAILRYQEARNEYGSRYVEYLKYCGIRNPSDARLQNPEFLGGSRATIQFSEVLQTAEGTNPVGTLKGHGISATRGRRFRKFFEEHGIVMTLMSVLPKTMYVDAVDRGWVRQTKEDYFQKEFQNLGDQEIFNLEASFDHSNGALTFGYQKRYDEYRFKKSGVAGEFRDTLDYWHMGRKYASPDVALNTSFVTSNPTKRVYADQSSDSLQIMAMHSIQARRPIAKFPKPRIL